MEELIKLLSDYYPLAPELLVTLLQRFSKEVHRKNKRILEPGHICDWIAFVEKGLVKVYYEPEEGAELVAGFHKEGDVIGFTGSYIRNVPSNHSIQVIEETHLRKIRKIELEAICAKYPAFYLHLLKILETKFGRLEDHCQLLMEPSRKRLPLIQQQEPWLLEDKRIKDYMLAAYLGIDKATLSRYRNGK
jgi:CRP-like cAMP-binding protein